jgi:iron complex transport system ATP-binding protein
MMAGRPTLTVEHVSVRYGAIRALADVSVTARAGRVIALLGPNAAGKSTLLRTSIGAQKASAGRALLHGADVCGLRARDRAARIAYVPQRSHVAAAFTVQQVISLGRYALAPDPDRIVDALERLELGSLADRPYASLSVGQQQRVTLARAIAQLAPEGLLVLDEPLSGMDPAHVRRAMSILLDLAAGGATVIIAMHDITLAAGVADEAWVLRDGRVHAAGDVEDVLTPERLEAVFDAPFDWHACDGRRVPLPRPPRRRASAGNASPEEL